MFLTSNLLRTRSSGFMFSSRSSFRSCALHTSPPGHKVLPKAAAPLPKGARAGSMFSRYGYPGIAVYFTISALDLAILFGLVHTLGEEKVIELENAGKDYLGIGKPSDRDTYGGRIDDSDDIGITKKPQPPVPTPENHRNKTTLFTEFGIAYAVHRSLFFVRLPLTLVITPAVVNILQKRGYKIGQAATPKSKFGTPATGGQRFGSWFF